MRCKRTIIAVLMLALTLVAQVPIGTRQPGAGVNFYNFEKEEALGSKLADHIRAQTTPVNDPEIAARIERLSNRLAEKIPGRAWNWRFTVIEDDRGGSTHEPLSFPGGYIFVSAHLIDAVQNEAELAGMLAHAMSHVAQRHGTRQATRAEIANRATIPLIFMGGWSGIGAGDSNVAPVGFRSFQRKFELDADAFDARMMSDAGFDPSALVRYIRRTQIDPPGQLAAMPGLQERISSLEQAIAALPLR